MIRVEDLLFKYEKGGEAVLKKIYVDIKEGEYVAIIGPNGCGKTTLIKHFNALLSPSKGEVWVDGMNTKDPDAVPKVRQKVGMVFQNPDNQIVGMTVEEDVSFGPGNLCLSPPEIRERVQSSLALVGMENHGKRAPHTLSSGEKQLVAIAGVMAMNPKYIVFDEPTAHLDPAGRKRVLEVIRNLNREGITIIHVTHNMDEIVEVTRVIVMNGGGILLSEPPAEVFVKVQLLRDLGLDVPQVTELMWQLRQMGIDVRPEILTLDGAREEISSLIKRRA